METKLKVTLMEHTPNPERLVSAAAKLCYSDCGIDEITENLTDEIVNKFVGMLADVGHDSPLAHICFTFGVEGVSRVLTHQLVRHSVGTGFSQKSQRYVNEGSFEYIIPPEIAKDPLMTEIFKTTMIMDQEVYDLMVEMLMAKGRTEKESIEDARFLLPNACETKIVVTMNARALMNFFKKRCCNRAQWEIRAMAEMMLVECKKVAPILFKNAGALCVKGMCLEGSFSCGHPKCR